jgi:hypothetical protein
MIVETVGQTSLTYQTSYKGRWLIAHLAFVAVYEHSVAARQ